MGLIHRFLLAIHRCRWGKSFTSNQVTYRTCEICGKQQAQMIVIARDPGGRLTHKTFWS